MNNIKRWIVNHYPRFGWLIRYKQEIDGEPDEKDHVLGDANLFGGTLKEDGDWLSVVNGIKDFFEAQKGRLMDSIGCTAYGTYNAIELLARLMWGEVWNKSDRFTNVVTGTTRSGNSVPRILESIRKKDGAVDEEDYPWDRNTFTWNNYYAPIPKTIIEKAKAFPKEYKFNYKRIGTDHNSIKHGLTISPVPAGGYAWYLRKGKYVSVGSPNHWFVILKQVWGEKYIILDSYPPYIKELDWNFKFHFPRVFYLEKKKKEFNPIEIQKLMKRGLKYIIRVFGAGEVYELKTDRLTKIEPQEIRNMTIKSLADAKKIIGIDESVFYKLLK